MDRRPVLETRRQVFDIEDRSSAEDERALDHVLELTDVPRPGVSAERRHRVGRHRGSRLSKLSAMLLEQTADERRQVVGPLTEWRAPYFNQLFSGPPGLPETRRPHHR